MRQLGTFLSTLALVACASTPRAPSDAEVRAQLDRMLQDAVQAVAAGNVDAFLTNFTLDAKMIIRGITGGDGSVINVDLNGVAEIRSFVMEAGAPPGFGMVVSDFQRNGAEAVQTGQWSIAEMQSGPFTITWRMGDAGSWRVITWRFTGGAS